MKVLIVDDHEGTRDGLAKLISATWGMPGVPLVIVAVATLREGLAEARDANVTVLDLDLPDSSPEQSIAAIHLFQPPVIVLTGHHDDALAAACMAAGAAHVYVKGSLIGFLPNFFEALQRDVVRRAAERNASHDAP